MNKKTVFCASIALILAGTVLSGELVPDDKTLFLCNFNDKIDADFAKGAAGRLKGNAGITRDKGGKYGEGLICKEGMVSTILGIDTPYYQMDFPMAGNINLKEGTLEFWTKMDFSRKLPEGKDFCLYYFIDIPTNLTDQKGLQKRVTLVVQEIRGASPEKIPGKEVFHYFMGTGEAITSSVEWQPNEWHHVAITWNETETSLFLDGRKIGSKPLKGGLFEGKQSVCKESFLIGGLWNSLSSSGPDGVLDEFRISNTVRYTDNFTP